MYFFSRVGGKTKVSSRRKKQILGKRRGDAGLYNAAKPYGPRGWEVEQIKKNKWQTVSPDPSEGGGEVGKWVKERRRKRAPPFFPSFLPSLSQSLNLRETQQHLLNPCLLLANATATKAT